MALFTAETAAEMGKRGALACAEVKQRRKILDADPAQESAQADEFRKISLARVRKQLGLIDNLIEEEMAKESPDAGKIDRYASAAIRLNERERQLSNRSLPPTLKAGTVKPARRTSGPDLPEPAAE